MLKVKELRDQSQQELELLITDSERELFQLRNKAKQEKSEKPHLIKGKRKYIAQLKTVLRQKQLAE